MGSQETLTDVTPSGDGAQSADVNTGSTTESQAPEITAKATQTLDGLKKLAKDGEAFKPKTIEESVKEETKPQAPVVPAFTPNFKYKAALQEKEVEEFWRPLMKDEESAQKVIRALQKLDGFEFVEQSRNNIEKQFKSLQGDYDSQAQVVQRVESSLERGDLSSAFRQLGLRDEDVYRWTQQKLQMMELPAEQRRALEEAENARLERFTYEEQISQNQKLYEDQAVQLRTMQLDFVLSRPEVAQAAHGWDSLMGQSGAFRDLVIQEAQTAFYREKTDLTAEQAAQRVLQKYGNAMKAQQQQSMAQTMSAPQAPQAMQVGVPQAKPVIPSVTAKGTTPIKKVPRSLEDLHRLRKELESSTT